MCGYTYVSKDVFKRYTFDFTNYNKFVEKENYNKFTENE